MAGHSGNPTAAEAETLAGIRRAAEATLAAWPEARAAVLFGSRARGDHLPSSDWDIAFITRNGTRVRTIPAGLPIGTLAGDIKALAVPEELARRKALSIGHVGRGIVRDGRLLAGGWNRPDVNGELAMEPERFGFFVRNAVINIREAANHAREAAAGRDLADSVTSAAHFVAKSADAAEHLAKAMLGRRGIDPDTTHEASQLAEQAERAGHPELAESIRSMDGFTRTHHTAVYGFDDANALRHAVQRLPAVIRELEREIASAARDPEYAAAAFSAGGHAASTIGESAAALRLALEQDGRDSERFQSHEWLPLLVEARPKLLSELTQVVERLRPITEPGGGRSRDTGRSQSIFD